MTTLLPNVLILASGRGTRFTASGGSGSKLMADLGGVTVLERTLTAVRASGLPWHLENAGHPGMGDSIASAVHATLGACGWLVLPGDLPLISAGTLRAVANELLLQPLTDVVMPMHAGKRGHPVGFSGRLGTSLQELSGADGAIALVRAAQATGRATALEVNDRGIFMDIDTLDDLRRARNHLSVLNSVEI